MCLNGRYLQLVVLSTVVIAIVLLYGQSYGIPTSVRTIYEHETEATPNPADITLPKLPDRKPHPIDELVRRAHENSERVREAQSHGVPSAAQAYRARRGRHPPPRFDEWVKWCDDHEVIIIEDLFDQIYDDLNPFWAIPARQLRAAASGWKTVISVRNGIATQKSDQRRAWMDLWENMFKQIEQYLPDVDVAVNEMDEPRMIVPWKQVHDLVSKSVRERNLREPWPDWITYESFQPLQPRLDAEADLVKDSSSNWSTSDPYWLLARRACPPDSEASEANLTADFSKPPSFPFSWAPNSYLGYVADWGFAKSVCGNPHLRDLHASFIEPISTSTTPDIFPLFGGSKIAGINNEILLPAPMYWSDEAFYSGGNHFIPWEDKRDSIMWRGAASGGRNHEHNWRHFQRHRLISMLNATQVHDTVVEQHRLQHRVLEPGADSIAEPPRNFPPPDPALFPLTEHPNSLTPTIMRNWIEQVADAAFTHLLCFPEQAGFAPTCPYTDPFYSVAPHVEMREQYKQKYLFDIDGNSFSGRYRAFLRSNSLPIKATVYSEWHDSRLIPWKHFVPMDNTFNDLYGIMAYFLGGPEEYTDDWQPEQPRGRDNVAQAIAHSGADWAAQALRKEDMLAYVYRLMLEYARVCDDRRQEMAFVQDLRPADWHGETF